MLKCGPDQVYAVISDLCGRTLLRLGLICDPRQAEEMVEDAGAVDAQAAVLVLAGDPRAQTPDHRRGLLGDRRA